MIKYPKTGHFRQAKGNIGARTYFQGKNLQRVITFIALIFFGCDPVNLTPIPEPDTGPDAGEAFIPRDPLPDAGEPLPEECELQFVWNEDYLPLGECRPGLRCGDDVVPPVTAKPEECGDLKDNDCDGLTDEREGGVRAVIAVVDGSGSMRGAGASPLGTLRQAVCNGRFESYYWALVMFDNESFIVHPFAYGTQSLCAALGSPSVHAEFSSSEEYAARAMRTALEGGPQIFTGNPATLVWPVGASRSVLIVTDEPPDDPDLTDGTPLVRELCTTYGVRVDVVTPSVYHTRWVTTVQHCGGSLGALPLVPSVMETELVTILGTGC